MTQRTHWPSREEMLKKGITVDDELDNEVPDYARAKPSENATGLNSRPEGEGSPPAPGAKPAA